MVSKAPSPSNVLSSSMSLELIDLGAGLWNILARGAGMMCLPSTDDDEGNEGIDLGAGTSTTSTVYCDESSFSPVSSLFRLIVDSTHLRAQTVTY